MYLIVIFLLSGLIANAQSNVAKIAGPSLVFEMRRGGAELSKHDNFKFDNMEIEAMFGYTFSRRISFYIPLTETVGLFKEQANKTYELATQLGLGVGYNPLYTSKIQLEIVGKMGSTLGGNWQFMYYDGGVRLGFPNRLYIGAGVRYYSCYSGDFGNHCNFYVALGGRLNFYKHRNCAAR